MPRDETTPLKRFRNLDIDGVTRPPRPRPAEPPRESRAPTTSRPAAQPVTARTPTAPRPAAPGPSAPPRRANVPDAPAPGRGMTRATVSVDLRGGGGVRVATAPPPAPPRGAVEAIPPGTRPGVLTVEVDRGRRVEPSASWPPAPPLRRSVSFTPPASQGGRAPIELTEMAARQIRLLAYQHGVTGAGLRILTSGPGGPEHCDFAFEGEPEPDDVVFLSHGVRVIVDPASLRTLRGLRVTYQDLPGAEGFRLG